MRIIADLHIHSKFSRATSKDMVLDKIAEIALKKGINLIGTGDFTHPGWVAEIKQKLEPAENGFLKLKDEKNPKVHFIPTSEISTIYSKGGQVRKIHTIIFAPNIEIVEKINSKLAKIGNLWSDGRPILGLDAKELAKIILDICPDCLIVPAHAWTPWFSVFGANSGFDSLEECYEELTPQIRAIETGLSSDPKMNWRLSALDNITLISNSDAHSPQKLGREANVFEIPAEKYSCQEIINIIKNKDPKKFLYTIEFFPEEGKYHFDGHRNCNLSYRPEETIEHKFLCPVCGRRLTVGVMHRVEKLADRKEGLKPKNSPDYKSLIPLAEILGEVFQTAPYTKKVQNEYEKLVTNLASEFEILIDFSVQEIEKVSGPEVASAIENVRQGKVNIQPGFDGVFGKISLQKEISQKNINPVQDKLF